MSRDVALSYKMLRHVNTIVFGLRRKIDSIREALVYLGMEPMKNLASLFLLAQIDDKPLELLRTAMLRAKMCELMAKAHGRVDVNQAFTVGLFSTLEAIMDLPMETVLERLPLGKNVRDALLDGEGDLAAILASTLAYERGDWRRVPCPDLSRGQIKAAFLAAVGWVDRVGDELSS